MEDLVAVAITFRDARTRYVITYAQIFDPVDPSELEAVVLKAARTSDLGGTPLSASLCATLQEAAGEPFFFEALFE